MRDGNTTQMTWDKAKTWAEDLNYGGYDDWHLPTTPDGLLKANGIVLWEYDTTKITTKYNVTYSELGHLYYTELGLKGYLAPGTDITYNASYGLHNEAAPYFTNLRAGYYWFETSSASDPSLAWVFDFEYGIQFLQSKNSPNAYAIAVRSAVPEPASAFLFLSGLTGTLWHLRRKRK